MRERVTGTSSRQIVAISVNGAGKSTLLRTISGLLRPREGRILFKGEEISSVPAHRIVQLGISHSPEGRRIFTNMSVHENLQLGAFTRKDGEIGADLEEVLNRFPRLRERFSRARHAEAFEQQMRAIGRALSRAPILRLAAFLGPGPTSSRYLQLRPGEHRGETVLWRA